MLSDGDGEGGEGDGWETASEEESDGEEEWVDVHHSSDEDVEVRASGVWQV